MAKSFAARTRLSVKFALLVTAIFGAALTALGLVQRSQRQSLADLLASETRERSAMMGKVVGMTGQALRDFTMDYSQWDDMVTFVAAPRREWAAINIDASVETFALAAVWVLRPDGAQVYASRGEKRSRALPVLPFSAAEVGRIVAAGKSGCCFVMRPDGLLEVCYAPIQPSADTGRASEPRGWLLGARLWDEAQLRLLADVVQCETKLGAPDVVLPVPRPELVSLKHPLRGLDGAVVANLIYTLRSNELEIAARHQRTEFVLFAGTFLLATAVAAWFVWRWILRPLRDVGESLRARAVQPIVPLLERPDEIGRVAHAVKTSFDQRAALEEMIEGRARLGRELHDGVIQTVFAAGMSLAGARASLRHDPAAAERILDDTRAELNSTIRSLRDFIHGLEPEPLQERTFRDSVQSIVNLMQGVRSVTSTLQIDEGAAAALDGRQRLHLLQITREAVSNSVRHGQSKHIAIRLEREGTKIRLEITDDGIGLEGTSGEGGRGLANFTARARELGADLEMIAVPTGGLRIRLVLPAANLHGAASE